MYVEFKHLVEKRINETYNTWMTINLHNDGFPSILSPHIYNSGDKLFLFSIPFAGLVLFVCWFVYLGEDFVPGASLWGLCKLPNHCHSRLHKFLILDRLLLATPAFPSWFFPKQCFGSLVRRCKLRQNWLIRK